MRTAVRLALVSGTILLTVAGAGIATRAGDMEGSLRVCADPDNLPYSARDRTGFENKLAELVAGELGKSVEYTWWPQLRGFVRKTLKAHHCDVIMGVPAQYQLVETTRPYYRSAYVFVSLASKNLDLHSIRDPQLKTLRIGVQLIGNDGFNTPPAHALGSQGIVDNVKGYTVYSGYGAESHQSPIVEAVERGDVDVAAVWGPSAGYFAKLFPAPLRIAPIEDTGEFAPLKFQFDIAMGVRRGDDVLRDRLDQVLVRKQPEIRKLLEDYGVPLVPTSDDRNATNGGRKEASQK